MPGDKLSYPGRNYLFAPGPTHIPNQVLTAMNVPQEDHRAPDFPKLVKPLLEDLKKIFRTKKGQCFIFPATGTAGAGRASRVDAEPSPTGVDVPGGAEGC